MKRFALVLLALATALAITPAALADTWNFTYTGSGDNIFAWGTITGNLIAPGEYFLTSGTITLIGADQPKLNGTGTLVSPPPQPFQVGGGTQLIGLDDLFLPDSNPELTVNGGLSFIMASGFGVGIGGNGPGSYWLFGSSTPNGAWDPNDNGSFVTPEPSSLFLLGTGLLGLAIILFRKAKPSGLVLNM